MKRCMIGAALGIVALLLFAAPQVRADGVDKFTLTENLGGGNTLAVTWSLPASPTTGTAYPGAGIGFTAPLVTYTYSYDGSVTSTTSNVNLSIYDAGYSAKTGDYGGLLVHDLNNSLALYLATSGSGTQIFSGTESNPTFNLGTYNFTDDATGRGYAATLVISTAEPSALLLLLVGLMATAVALGMKQARA